VVAGFSFDYGVMPGLEITSYLPVVWRGGGGLDQVIDGWHSFFSLPRGDRRRVSDDAYSLSGDNEDGSEFAIEQEGWGLGVGSLGLKYQLPAAGETKISTLFQLGLPGTTGYAQQSLEILQGLVAERCSAATCYYLGGAGLYASDQVVQGLRQRAFHAEWFAGAQYQWNPKIQLLATLYGSTKAVSGVINHPNYALYLDLGARVLLTEATALEAILRENPGPGAGTVDVSFHLGLSRGF
jgi:hypothetical protein